MALQDYVPAGSDRFELGSEYRDDFAFPCSVCRFSFTTENHLPCCDCAHNANSGQGVADA